MDTTTQACDQEQVCKKIEQTVSQPSLAPFINLVIFSS